MSISITSADRVHVVGDSITNPVGPNGGWHLRPTGFKDRLQGVGFAYAPGATAPPRQLAPVTVTEFGVNGQAIAAVDAAFATQVTPFNPTVLIVQIGVNDVATPGSAFTASYSSVVAKSLALNPNMKFLLGAAMVFGELWGAGPVYAGNVNDVAIAALNVLILAQVTALKAVGSSAEYLDWRLGAARMEATRNAPAPGVTGGRVTLDGVHPTFETCLMMGDVAYAQVVRT